MNKLYNYYLRSSLFKLLIRVSLNLNRFELLCCWLCGDLQTRVSLIDQLAEMSKKLE